jgi:rhamnose utilization protein RhaD (predicted bifunctional aldolase and dehydrogenase)
MTKNLLELAHQIGAHPSRLTIWNEGSCAVKLSPTRFAVSASGANLAQLTEADLLEFELGPVQALSLSEKATDEEIAAALPASTGRLPSLDVFLYAYFFSFEGLNYAAHTQPSSINQILGSPRARQFADRRISPSEVLGCGSASLLVPYADPGLPLAREIRRKMILWRDRYKVSPHLVLLQNHGMIVLGETTSDLLRMTDMTLKAAEIFIGAAMLGGPVFLTPSNVTQIEALKGS